ncbi:MAG: NADH-quinone oxidoreductase subunit NuoK [candidate division Zixibacteria bacterium]|nr:NADH-quinone oxidoreductase subunit NuoK [candidate division Zixibacteria bacterium]
MGLHHYLALSAVVFCIGIYGMLTRRNAIGVLMSVELMFNAANIALVAFGRFVTPQLVTGQVVAAFTIAVAAAEATVALAIVLLIYQHHRGIDVDRINIMKW